MLDIGDKEGTLCESNEELHRLLLERQIPHEWEVRSGGHDFTCWNTALPKAFRFINEYFNGKQSGNSESSLPNETPFIQTANATVYYPEQAQGSTRNILLSMYREKSTNNSKRFSSVSFIKW